MTPQARNLKGFDCTRKRFRVPGLVPCGTATKAGAVGRHEPPAVTTCALRGLALRGGRPPYQGDFRPLDKGARGENRYFRTTYGNFNKNLFMIKIPQKNDKFAARNLRLLEIDYEILRLIYEHRFLNTELIWHLIKSTALEKRYLKAKAGKDGKERPSSYGFSLKALYKHLQRLYETKYLNRLYLTDLPIGGSYGAPRAVYGLGVKSAPVIAEIAGTTIQHVRNIVEANRLKSPFLRHALEIARFRATLELACRLSRDKIRPIFWEQGLGLRDYSEGKNEYSEIERFPVNPDAFFGIQVRGKGNASYFLEMDRGTMPIISKKDRPDIRKKTFGYMYYRKSGKYREKYYYGILPNGEPSGLHINQQDDAYIEQNEFLQPIKGFSVLFVVPGTLYKDKSVSGRIENILSTFPFFGKSFASTSLFWLTTQEAYDIENPESILGNIWITPNPDKPAQSLIE